MKQKDFHIYLTEQERTQVITSLIELKSSLMVQIKSFGGKLPAVTNGRQALRLVPTVRIARFVW